MMNRMMTMGLLTLTLALGCGKKEEPATDPSTTVQTAAQPAVTAITFTRGIDSSNNPVATTNNFNARDTIYAVVDVTNTEAGTPIEGRWFHVSSDQQVNTNTVNTTSAGSHKIPLFISRPDAWPTGDYRLDVYINGMMQKSQSFKVEEGLK